MIPNFIHWLNNCFKVYAPYMHTIPLPSSRPTGAQPTSDGANTLYPIGVVSGLPPAKEIKLGTLTLACLIHIPTPQVHIGTIHSLNPGEDVNALDLFHSLQVLMQRSLDVHVTYPQLPEQMKAEIKAAFIRRNGQPLSSAMIWEAFILGQPTRGGPTWQDLLLGNANIWGVEEQSVRGYSVIHLA